MTCLTVLVLRDRSPLGWRAHGRNARGRADHEDMVVDLFRVTKNLILFCETGVLDRELNLASIPYMESPEGLRHYSFCLQSAGRSSS
jgi:hypothetical protein